MTFAPAGLNLSAKQAEVLTELGIDHTKLYFLDNDKLGSGTPPINAYSSGHYVVFSASEDTADEAQMRSFMAALYGPGTYELEAKFRNLYVYAAPSARFVETANLVNVTVSPP